ncbi:MAG: PQQ-dependent sugar dehydrogenase [Pseudomonadota bacterium]|nr:PQQ-dependent sugar dehydrogenase [Pseudomonadota bacterium]
MNLYDVVCRRLLIRGAVLFGSLALISLAPQSASSAESIGIAPVRVGAGPYQYDTAEQHDIRVDVLARGLEHAYSLAFLPNGDALVVERGARLRLIRNVTSAKPTLVGEAITGAPSFTDNEQATADDVFGLQDVSVHPQFAQNRLVYYTFNRPVSFDATAKRLRATTVLARARLEGMRLVDAKDLLVGEAVQDSGGSRILFGKDNIVYVSVGAVSRGDIQTAQRTDNIYGKVLRLKDDGSVPADNPFVKTPGTRPEIYSLGHRDPLGMAVDPRTGAVIASEHGPLGGDEINRILPGRNYGWPTYTYGTDYEGSPLPKVPVGPNTEGPVMVWMPAIAPSGIVFYDGNEIPAWKNNLFVASARRGEIDRTGSLVRVVLDEKLQEVRQEQLLLDLHQRFKDVRQGPDGLLYVLTDEDDSVLMRISPAPARTPAAASDT